MDGVGKPKKGSFSGQDLGTLGHWDSENWEFFFLFIKDPGERSWHEGIGRDWSEISKLYGYHMSCKSYSNVTKYVCQNIQNIKHGEWKS